MPRIVAWLVVVAGLLGARALEVEAAYRVTFQNGTSVEVQGYDDVGDAIRYPRYGGTITVPKAQVMAIEEVSPRLPPPATLATPPTTSVTPVSPYGLGVLGAGVPKVPRNEPKSETGILPSGGPAGRQEAPPRPASGQSRQVGRSLLSGPSLVNFFLPILMTLVIVWLGLRRYGVLGSEDGVLPYEKRGALLSPAERSFYGVLAGAVADRYSIFAKVRLGDLFAVAPHARQYWKYRNQIDRKHVDFVLCTLDELSPVLAIELDDASHARASRRARDAFVDQAFTAADVPLLRIPAQAGYAPAELRDRIEQAVAGKSRSRAFAEVTF